MGRRCAAESRKQKRPCRDNLQVKEIIVGDGERRNRYILCYNPVEAEKAKHDREKIICDLKVELDSIRQLQGEAHTKAMCALRSHKLYGKYVKQLANGTLKLNQAAIQDAGRFYHRREERSARTSPCAGWLSCSSGSASTKPVKPGKTSVSNSKGCRSAHSLPGTVRSNK